MMTNEKALWVILMVFIVGAAVYIALSKFKQDIEPVSSPSPSPANLDFVFNKAPNTPTQNQQAQQPSQVQQGQQTQQAPQPQASELPLAKNKRLAQFPGILKPEVLQNKKVVIATKKGVIQIEVYPEASMSASNFLILAANGFYDGLIFHRVDKDPPVIQGGDPLGNGTGGPGYAFPDEPVTRSYKKGTVAMANAGPNTNGSQFFIMTADYSFPPNYTIFGAVIAGGDVVDKIAVGDVMDKVVVQNLK